MLFRSEPVRQIQPDQFIEGDAVRGCGGNADLRAVFGVEDAQRFVNAIAADERGVLRFGELLGECRGQIVLDIEL